MGSQQNDRMLRLLLLHQTLNLTIWQQRVAVRLQVQYQCYPTVLYLVRTVL
jgi:hypothetical protein